MKICAVTMVYKDYWALSQWYSHYGRQLGAENLFVVAHGADPKVAELCPGASIITVPRDQLDGFDRWRSTMLNAFQAGLHQAYDWVIRTDADELVCAREGLVEALQAQQAPAVFALGLDLVEHPSDAPLATEAMFKNRKNAAFSGHYSKAVAARRPVSFMRHGIQLSPKRLEDFPFQMPDGLYLAHIKYANLDALKHGTQVREAVANGPGSGLPGGGWQAAGADARNFLERFHAKDPVNWQEAKNAAFAKISKRGVRDAKHNILRARAVKFQVRTQLPDWFAQQ